MATTLTVDATELPFSLEAGANFTISTETHILTSWNGRETRHSKRAPKIMCTLNVSPDYADDLVTLFRAQLGPEYAFTVKDPTDYIATDEPLELDVDGNFPLVKTYATGDREQVRRILLPDAASIVIKHNTVQTNSWTLMDPGLIVPAFGAVSGDLVTWTGTFKVPMRFAVDQLPASLLAGQNDGILRIVQVNLLEIFEDPDEL